MAKEYCGLFGISQHEDAARLTYFGLYAQQHRGQEGAGIAVWDGSQISAKRELGLVHDIFQEDDISRTLKGQTSIGHVRYALRRKKSQSEVEPFIVHRMGLDLAIAHNGSLINANELRLELEAQGSIFQTLTDSEVFAHLIARNLQHLSIEESILAACAKVKGAYSLLILANDLLIGVRDPHGVKPLSLGKLGDSYLFASETCAFDLLEAELIRSVKAGEMLVIHGKGSKEIKSYELAGQVEEKKRAQCIFELVYYARPDSSIYDQNVYLARKRMGYALAQEYPVDADFIMPFPDSGVYCALGYASASQIPYEHGLIRNHYVGRTFIQPSQNMRDFSVRIKLNPVKELIKGKRIIIVDDSIVRGTTMRTRVKKLRELGAREVHCRISCPPVLFPCHYGLDFSTRGELIAANHSIEEIQKFLDLDSLHFLSLEKLIESVKPAGYCTACFTGNYPI